MEALYLKHNPSKTAEVDTLLKKYKGKEVAMWSALAKKYGADAIEEAKESAKSAEQADLESDAPDFDSPQDVHDSKSEPRRLTEGHQEETEHGNHRVAQDAGHVAQATAASKHAHDKHTADNTSEAEMIAYQKVHGREESSKALTKAHEEWEKRDHHTVAQDMGHLAQATAASKHAHDKHTADNTSEAEMIAYQKVHGREESSKALTKAHEEWEKRDHHTKVDKLGHFATETAASKHHHDKAHDVDHEPEGEHIAYMRTHERELMSQQLTLEKEAWEQRDHATVADDVGHLGSATEASKHHNDKHTSDNTSKTEMMQYQRVHARAEMSKALAKDRNTWQKRSELMRKQAMARFKALDADGNGSLDLNEVLSGAHLLNLSEDQARAWFQELDVDGSGDVDIDEFLARSARQTEAHVCIGLSKRIKTLLISNVKL